MSGWENTWKERELGSEIKSELTVSEKEMTEKQWMEKQNEDKREGQKRMEGEEDVETEIKRRLEKQGEEYPTKEKLTGDEC